MPLSDPDRTPSGSVGVTTEASRCPAHLPSASVSAKHTALERLRRTVTTQIFLVIRNNRGATETFFPPDRATPEIVI